MRGGRTDAFILIGVEEVQGGRSNPVGVAKHLDDAKLQQLLNSKSNRKIDFRYEAVPVDGITIGVIHVPLQERPSYLTTDYGKLKRDTVYLRRGSSTDIAKPDEIARMGSRAERLRPPKLVLAGRAVQQFGTAVVLQISNESGSGSARAPRLVITSRGGPWGESRFGLDGNGNVGLPRIPQGSDTGILAYGGDGRTVIPAGAAHDVSLPGI
jgi:hypothetical protein